MKKMYGLEVEKYISMDDEKELEKLDDYKYKYYGEYDLDVECEKVGYVWGDEYGVIRVLYDDEENDRVVVYLVY